MHDATLKVAQLKGLAILEEDVKLGSILIEFLLQIEHLLECALHGCDMFADAGLGTGEALAKAGTARHVIGMDVTFADVLNIELVLLAKGGNLIVMVGTSTAGGKIEIHHRIYDHGLVGVGVHDDIGQGRSALVVKCGNSWFALYGRRINNKEGGEQRRNELIVVIKKKAGIRLDSIRCESKGANKHMRQCRPQSQTAAQLTGIKWQWTYLDSTHHGWRCFCCSWIG